MWKVVVFFPGWGVGVVIRKEGGNARLAGRLLGAACKLWSGEVSVISRSLSYEGQLV